MVWSYAQVESAAQTKVVRAFKELLEEAKQDLQQDVSEISRTLQLAMEKQD